MRRLLAFATLFVATTGYYRAPAPPKPPQRPFFTTPHVYAKWSYGMRVPENTTPAKDLNDAEKQYCVWNVDIDWYNQQVYQINDWYRTVYGKTPYALLTHPPPDPQPAYQPQQQSGKTKSQQYQAPAQASAYQQSGQTQNQQYQAPAQASAYQQSGQTQNQQYQAPAQASAYQQSGQSQNQQYQAPAQASAYQQSEQTQNNQQAQAFPQSSDQQSVESETVNQSSGDVEPIVDNSLDGDGELGSNNDNDNMTEDEEEDEEIRQFMRDEAARSSATDHWKLVQGYYLLLTLMAVIICL